MIKRILTYLLLITTIICIFLQCTKVDDIGQVDAGNAISSSNDKVMTPGPDPYLISYSENNESMLRLGAPFNINNVWERYMYVDRTDTLYNNVQGKNTFARYLHKYNFTGVYLYSTNSVLASSNNYVPFASFLKQLSDSGITFRAAVKENSTNFSITGDVTAYNNSQTDQAKKINRANLELEWWNYVCTWSVWNTRNIGVSLGTVYDNDFYEGWYINMSPVVDTVAAKDQVLYSDRILLHCYQNGIPTYSYANAQSSGATGGRLDIIAKGAQQANKRIDLYIIISAENTAWGASNTFSGPVLAAARVGGSANPFLTIETQAYNNIYTNMTSFHKQWINLKGFVWFTKRYCYRAVPPM